MLKTLLNIILLLASFTIFAQSTITGNVLDEAKQPLSFTNIVIYENENNTPLKAVIVSANGTYMLTNIKNGNYIIEASGEF